MAILCDRGIFLFSLPEEIYNNPKNIQNIDYIR
jgi:hypothetical protein